MTVLLRFFGFDRALAYSVLLRAWQSAAGLVGIFLIARYFSAEVQGFYYTFASLVALQSFVELGLYLVISNSASHEWAKLHLSEGGHIEGDADALSRLVSLGRFVFKWYAAASLIFLLLGGAGGCWFLGQSSAAQVEWQIPWILHVAFSSLLLWCMPFLSLIEGCDQIAQVARFRFWQSLVSSLVFWAAMAAGCGLWAAPALSAVSALFCMQYLLFGRRRFFQPFFRAPASTPMAWRTEIFPMQWRLALQGVMNYFAYSLFTPVLFYYHGPTAAGQLGMTQQIVTAILSFALLWVTTRAPRFGMLVAKRDFHALDLEWRKAAILSVSLMTLGVMAGFAAILVLTEMEWAPVIRVLPPVSYLMFAGGAIFGAWIQCFAIYLRAHRKEVLTATGVISGALMGLLVWQLGAAYGTLGAAASYLVVVSCVSFPMACLVWNRARNDWHG